MPELIRSEKAFKKMAAQVLSDAKRALQADGALAPAAFMVLEDGRVAGVADFHDAIFEAERLHSEGRSNEAIRLKEDYGNNLRDLAKQIRAVGFIYITEAWFSEIKPEDIDIAYGDAPGMERVKAAEAPLPRFDPRKREVIVLNWEWKGYPDYQYKTGQTMQFFRRDPQIVMEEVVPGGYVASASMFAGFLRDPDAAGPSGSQKLNGPGNKALRR